MQRTFESEKWPAVESSPPLPESAHRDSAVTAGWQRLPNWLILTEWRSMRLVTCSSLTPITTGFGRYRRAGLSRPSPVTAGRSSEVTAVWPRPQDWLALTDWRWMHLATFSSLTQATCGFGRCQPTGSSRLSLVAAFRGSN